MTTTPIHTQDWHRLSQTLSHCDNISKLAEFVMELRQKGVPKAEVMEVVLNNPRTSPEMVETVNKAYQVPQYPPGNHQSLAIKSFRQRIRLECVGKSR